VNHIVVVSRPACDHVVTTCAYGVTIAYPDSQFCTNSGTSTYPCRYGDRGYRMSIAQHIIDHARAVSFGSVESELLPAHDKTHHFKFSIDTAQLIAKGYLTKEQIDAKMLAFFDELKSLQYQYVESKGYTRHGKQRFRTCTLDLSSALIAYHNSSFKHKTNLIGNKGEVALSDTIGHGNTEPHFHVRFADDDKDRGKDYVNARNAIAELAKKHGVVFHFMENTVSENREQESRLSNFSWSIQNAKNKDIAYYVSESDKLTANLELLAKDAQKGNLQFYIKVLGNLQSRLQAQNLDFFWRGVNIKETFPLYLSQKDQESLSVISSGNMPAINELLNDRSNKIARGYLEYCAGFENHIINELLKRDYVLPKIDLSAFDLSRAQTPLLKEYFKKDRSTVDAQKAARVEPKTKQPKQAPEKQEYEEIFTANNEAASAVSIKRKDYLERQKLIDVAKVELQDARATFVNEALGYLSSTPQAVSELESELETIKSATAGKFALLGGAGAGKSYQARQIIENEEANGRKVLKLGSTDLAACNIAGQTIHSAFGIGIASNLEELEAFERKNRKIVDKALETIKAADTIIIDEISMVSKEQMDLLEYRLKQAGWSGKLIFVGDFL
jgi:PIF1-like helicase